MKDSNKYIENIDQLSTRELAQIRKRYALFCKYETAVDLYANTNSSIRDIAAKCNVSESGLKAYLQQYWRELMLQRHGIDTEGKNPYEIPFYKPDGGTFVASNKYEKAVHACESTDYIDLNISQIARKFGVDGAGLLNFMHIHFPKILAWREKVRTMIGLNDNKPRGLRKVCAEQYAKAVEMYKTTNMTVKAVAEYCNVSEGGLFQHLRFYHKDLLKWKKKLRQQAKSTHKKKKGELLGNGRTNEPLTATVEKYAEALEMYRNTALTMKEIVNKTGVSAGGFRSYLHKWYKALVLERSGIVAPEDAELNITRSRQRMKTVAVKYAPAIESLNKSPRPVSQAAIEFGHHPEVFRNYIRKHEPELVKLLGLKPLQNKKKLTTDNSKQ